MLLQFLSCCLASEIHTVFVVPFFVIIAGNFFFAGIFFLLFSHLLMINGHPQRQARDQDKKVKKNLKK
jgi:hypothetical protein